MIISPSDTPAAKAEALGSRLKQARLNRDWSQLELSKKSGVSRRLIIKAEKGIVSLQDFIALLDALGLSNSMDVLLPHQSISPMQLLKLKGKVRKKASGEHKADRKIQIKTAQVKAEW